MRGVLPNPFRDLDGLQQTFKEPVLFVTADRQILQATQAEELRLLNPETAT